MRIDSDIEEKPSTAYERLNHGRRQPVGATDTILAYIGAFTARDAGFMCRLFDDRSLVEIPMLRPIRLVGLREIESGHRRAFENIRHAEFKAMQPVAENAGAAIWVGTLKVRRANDALEDHRLAIVCEVTDGEPRRLTLHLDARNKRRWCDEAIL